jgi:hypothetical protein
LLAPDLLSLTQTGHHETPRDARQIGRQVVGVAVCKVFLLGVAAKLRLAKGSTTIDKRGGSSILTPGSVS